MKINIKELKDKVPDIIFRQGLDYFKDGRVKIQSTDNLAVMATVHGTYPYVVKLSIDGNSFTSTCTCPYKYVCKHAVSVALKVIEDQSTTEESTEIETTNWREYFERLIAIQQVDSEFSQEVRWKLIYIIHIT